MSRKCCIIILSFNRLPGSSFRYVLFLFLSPQNPTTLSDRIVFILVARARLIHLDSHILSFIPPVLIHSISLSQTKVPETGIHCCSGLKLESLS